MLIDSHCHLDFEDFAHDRDEVLKAAQINGVSAFIIPAVCAANFDKIIRLAQLDSSLYYALGLHPCFMDQHQLDFNHLDHVDTLDKFLEHNINSKSLVAIGECGLDFFINQAAHNLEAQELQLLLFKAQLKLAQKYKLPLIIHARKALDRIIYEIKRCKDPSLKGVIHSFSGSMVQMEQVIALGFYCSFGGPITYPRSTKLQQLVKNIPLDKILLESDSPDQLNYSPIYPRQDTRNTPSSIVQVCQTIANIKEIPFKDIAAQTSFNARCLFGI